MESGTGADRARVNVNEEAILARLGDNLEPALKEAVRCQTASELMEVAEKHGIDLTEAEAEELLALISADADGLSTDQLDMITGGVTKYEAPCPKCGAMCLPVGRADSGVYRCRNSKCDQGLFRPGQ